MPFYTLLIGFLLCLCDGYGFFQDTLLHMLVFMKNLKKNLKVKGYLNYLLMIL